MKPDDYECHDRLYKTELQRGLFAKPEKSDVVGMTGQAAGAVDPTGLDGLASDLRHDVSFPTEVLVAQRQKVVDHKSCKENGF